MAEDDLMGIQSGVDTSRLSFQSDSVSARQSFQSESSVSTTSLVFDRINERLAVNLASKSTRNRSNRAPYGNGGGLADFDDDDPLKEEGTSDLETGPFLGAAAAAKGHQPMTSGLRRLIVIVSVLFVAAWVGLFLFYASTKQDRHSSQPKHNPQATVIQESGKKITLDQIQDGYWYANTHTIQWIAGSDGEDGLLLESGAEGKDYLVVEDVRKMNTDLAAGTQLVNSRTLVRSSTFEYQEKMYVAVDALPSKNHRHVLLSTNKESNWRHSSTAMYWILDVASQKTEPLIPDEPEARVQLAQWSPTSDMIAFTRDNNLYLRRLGSDQVITITDDGGAELFYGVPDWVYEEEVFSGARAAWWSEDGKYLAFLRTNETGVPEYPVQYFVSRPSGQQPKPGEENYPEVRQIKYPKAGAPNPVVDLQFYDVAQGDVFAVKLSGEFANDNRLITTVVWAGQQVLIKETNRVSDVMRVVLVDVASRTGKAVRTMDVTKIDGGWFEISQKTRYIPADSAKGRPEDGYIDTIIHENHDHLAYFTPLDNPEPIMLTSGDWEVDEAPSSVDLERNLVYFISTKDGSIQRHVYSVKLDGTDLRPLTDTTVDGYYSASFSSGASYALLNYKGPGVPWQKIMSTPSNAKKYEYMLEKNEALADKISTHELPLLIRGTIKVDGGRS